MDTQHLEEKLDRALAIVELPEKIPAIRTKKEYEAQAYALIETKKLLKQIEADKSEIIDPLRAVLDKLYEKYRNIRKPLEEAESVLKTRLEEFDVRITEKAIQSARKKAEKMENSAQAAALVHVAETDQHCPDVPGIQTRTVTDFVIRDPEKVPSYLNGVELRKIQTAPVKKLVKAGVEVPGVETVIRKQKAVKL